VEPRSRYFHDKQIQNRNLVAQVVLRTGYGDRVWGFINPGLNDPIGSILDSSETFFAQAELSAEPILERAPRLVSLSPLTESNQPLDQDVLGSWGQGQRSVLQFEAHNDDGAMTRMVGQEYTLNHDVYLFVGFPGLAWDHAQQRYKGSINRITLTKNKVRIEAETLC
jgi:hypothetical protein